jgi:hypothetical protein
LTTPFTIETFSTAPEPLAFASFAALLTPSWAATFPSETSVTT